MTPEDRQAVFTRLLQRLEAQNRRWRFGALVVAVGFMITVGAAFFIVTTTTSQVKTVTAQKFEVVDESGKVRAVLGLGEEGRPLLSFTDMNGSNRAALFVGQGESPGLALFDANKESRVGLFLVAGGEPTLEFYDANGRVLFSRP